MVKNTKNPEIFNSYVTEEADCSLQIAVCRKQWAEKEVITSL